MRIVVLVDDLDRMHRIELNALFKLLRGVPEFKQITYVCAFSKDSMVRQLTAHAHERSYYYKFIEKFFPVQIELSKIDFNILASEFDRRFEQVCKQFDLLPTEHNQDEFNRDFFPIWAKYGRRFLTNIRRLDLYFASLKSLFLFASKEINLQDAMLLELLREATPEIVESIYRHSYHFYQTDWRWETSLEVSRSEGGKERKAFLESLLGTISFEDRELAVGLLEELFPVVYEYRHGSRPLATPQAAVAEKQRRIYHPACFPCYFIHRAPLDKFSATEFDRFRRLMNEESDSPAMESKFFGTFGGLSFEPKRLDFLSWLMSSLDEFGARQRLALSRAICRVNFRYNPMELGGEFTAARNVLLGAVKSLPKQEGNELLTETVGNAASDVFSADLFFYATNPDRNRLRPDWEIDANGLKRTLQSRLKRKYLDGTESIFVLDRHSGLHVLYRWVSCGEQAKKDAHDYLDKEFNSAEKNVGRFLHWARGSDLFGGEEFDAVKHLYSTEKMAGFVNKPVAAIGISDDEKKAIEAFRTANAAAEPPDEELAEAKLIIDEARGGPVDWESVDLRVELNQATGSTFSILVRNLSDEEIDIRRITLRSNRIDLGDPLSPKTTRWVLPPNERQALSLDMRDSLKRLLITANGGHYRVKEAFHLEFCFLCQARGSTKELVKTIRVSTDEHNDAVSQDR